MVGDGDESQAIGPPIHAPVQSFQVVHFGGIQEIQEQLSGG